MQFDQSETRAPRRMKELPTFYYHEHFLEMLHFVSEHYAHVLSDEHRRIVREFHALTPDEQRLYVRLVNRKGQVFDAARLRYPELGQAAPLLAALRSKGWVRRPGVEHFDAVLRFLKRAEILAVVSSVLSGVGRSLKKSELIELARGHVSADDFMAQVATDRVVVQGHCREIRYLLFLFFGRLQDGLSQFTMRDLGLVRVNDGGGNYEPRFSERGEAEAQFLLAEQRAVVDREDTAELLRLAGNAELWPETAFAGVARERDALAYRLGRKLERAGEKSAALAVYRRGESGECSERVVRLLLADGQRDAAKRFLEVCMERPRSDEEALFAGDLYARKFDGKRTSVVTDRLREAPVLELDESLSGSPERAAAAWYEAQGLSSFRVENSLWRTLFGLLFWDELVGDADSAASSPFDFLPVSIRERRFRERHNEAIERIYALLDSPGALKRRLLQVSTRHYDRPNGVFRWRRRTLDALFALAEHGSGRAIRAVLEHFIDDYLAARYGYPDLMLLDNGTVRFVEIKAEGDALRRNQLLRLEQLRQAGFEAEVVRVRWVLDPDQDYVVVDVETTGGRGERHRVTEIGAVRVQNGRVVDTFSTLLNPQRTIPPNITRLTGISAAMVMDAPYFSDIAEDFERFLGDAIFVAHNVEFDYGFIAREFQRIGREFRMPKLCTCASMRRLYPGHASYSLANLCREYGIPLNNHHRALCDAEAAAELLLLVNEKRRERLIP
ncbi:MAG: exonuclease domain-containing protein [Pseudomonadota bacterium]